VVWFPLWGNLFLHVENELGKRRPLAELQLPIQVAYFMANSNGGLDSDSGFYFAWHLARLSSVSDPPSPRFASIFPILWFAQISTWRPWSWDPSLPQVLGAGLVCCPCFAVCAYPATLSKVKLQPGPPWKCIKRMWTGAKQWRLQSHSPSTKPHHPGWSWQTNDSPKGFRRRA